MPIKEPTLFITVEDFKSWKGFDKLLFDNVTNSNENIWFAIAVASSNIDYFSGFAISKQWPEQTATTFTDNVQTATAHYVRFLCTKGVDYTRGQASMAQGGIVYSESNPEDAYYIPPEVFNCLRNIKAYTTFQGFNVNVKPKQNFFSQFMGNGGEQNPLENYLQITNLISLDPRTKITQTHPKNIKGTVVNIDTSEIKVGGSTYKEGKGITISADNTISVKYDDASFHANEDNRIRLSITKPTNFPCTIILRQNQYADLITTNKSIIGGINENKTNIDKKQNILTAGKNIKIENNVISATGGGGDLTDYYKKEEANNKFEFKVKKTLVDLGANFIARPTYQNTTYQLKPNTKYVMELGLLTSWKGSIPTLYKKTLTEVNFKTSADFTFEQNIIHYGWNNSFIGINPILKLACSAENFTSSNTYPYIANLYEVSENKIQNIEPFAPIKNEKWTAVGTLSSDKKEIIYNFINGKTYRIFYCWLNNQTIHLIKSFIFFNTLKIQYIDSIRLKNVPDLQRNNINITLELTNHNIYINDKNDVIISGFLWKLEELQE